MDNTPFILYIITTCQCKAFSQPYLSLSSLRWSIFSSLCRSLKIALFFSRSVFFFGPPFFSVCSYSITRCTDISYKLDSGNNSESLVLYGCFWMISVTLYPLNCKLVRTFFFLASSSAFFLNSSSSFLAFSSWRWENNYNVATVVLPSTNAQCSRCPLAILVLQWGHSRLFCSDAPFLSPFGSSLALLSQTCASPEIQRG